jgi:hypothetical protein
MVVLPGMGDGGGLGAPLRLIKEFICADSACLPRSFLGTLEATFGAEVDNAGGRATRRADRLRARLGWEPGILNGGGEKPKWMRWRTFERLAAKHDQFVGRSMQAAALKFGPLVSDFRY